MLENVFSLGFNNNTATIATAGRWIIVFFFRFNIYARIRRHTCATRMIIMFYENSQHSSSL